MVKLRTQATAIVVVVALLTLYAYRPSGEYGDPDCDRRRVSVEVLWEPTPRERRMVESFVYLDGASVDGERGHVSPQRMIVRLCAVPGTVHRVSVVAWAVHWLPHAVTCRVSGDLAGGAVEHSKSDRCGATGVVRRAL